jgi:hypothetical protein
MKRIRNDDITINLAKTSWPPLWRQNDTWIGATILKWSNRIQFGEFRLKFVRNWMIRTPRRGSHVSSKLGVSPPRRLDFLCLADVMLGHGGWCKLPMRSPVAHVQVAFRFLQIQRMITVDSTGGGAKHEQLWWDMGRSSWKGDMCDSSQWVNTWYRMVMGATFIEISINFDIFWSQHLIRSRQDLPSGYLT